MFFAEYSLLAMFDTYPASKCTTQNMYTRICAGLVVIVSLRTALGSLKEEDEQFVWATISVYHFRNVCQLDSSQLSERNRPLTVAWYLADVAHIFFLDRCRQQQPASCKRAVLELWALARTYFAYKRSFKRSHDVYALVHDSSFVRFL